MELSKADQIKAAESLSFSQMELDDDIRFIDRLSDDELISLSETLQSEKGTA